MFGVWWVIGVVADHIGVNPLNYVVAGNVETDDDGVLVVESWDMNANDAVERIKRE